MLEILKLIGLVAVFWWSDLALVYAVGWCIINWMDPYRAGVPPELSAEAPISNGSTRLSTG